jgi:heptosyltransferase-3
VLAFHKIKRARAVRILYIGFKRFTSIFLVPSAIANALRIKFSNPGKKKVIVALVDHIGDIIASEPIDRFIAQGDPESFIIRIVRKRYKEVIQYNPNLAKIVTVSCLSEWILMRFLLHLFSKIRIVDLHIDGRVCFRHYLKIRNPNTSGIDIHNYFHHGNLLEVFSLTAGLPKINDQPIYHLPKSLPGLKLPQPYIIFHTSSNGESKSWTSEKWNALAKSLIEKGFYVVEIGLKARVENESPFFINCCGKLSFTQIALAVAHCFMFIGVDSAFAHFANAFNLPNRILLFGSLYDFKNYLPYSGMSSEKAQKFILRQEKSLDELPVEAVLKRVALIQ